jgi:mono/diheme cytochrome c family protein
MNNNKNSRTEKFAPARVWVLAPLSALLIVLQGLFMPPAQSQTANPAAAKRGAYIFAAAGCSHCHTAKKGAGNWLAGGRAMPTPFGSFFTPNITPDKATGIGRWSAKDFHTAIRHGKRPDGAAYFPAFPYAAYSGMRNKDIADLWAYLKTVPAIRRKNLAHQLDAPFGWRWLLGFWRLLYFTTGPLNDTPGKAAEWNRGRYLVEVLGHCAECHSPRNQLGGIDSDRRMAGGLLFAGVGKKPEVVPNITPHKKHGLGSWSADELDTLLSIGMLPDDDFVGGEMTAVVENLAKLSTADRKAMILYLRSLPAIDHNPAAK